MASADVQNAPLSAHQLGGPTPQLPVLRSNQGDSVAQASTGWMLQTPHNTPIEEMRKRYERDGYIWVKDVIPREDVLDMREQYAASPLISRLLSKGPISYFAQLSTTGILQPDTSPRDGVFNSSSDPLAYQGIGGAPQAHVHDLLDQIHTSPSYRDFLSHPSLRSFVRQFMSWKQEILLERAMLRHNCPGSLSTGIHYDQYFLRAGGAEFLTAWVPIGDCAPTGGGLMYLENSNQLGKEIEAGFLAKAAHLTPEERIDAFNVFMNSDGFLSHNAEEFMRLYCRDGKGKWLVGDYEAGDVVFHKPYMIHAATRNEDVKGSIRLASDLRFYEAGSEVDERWRKIWRHDDGL